MKLTIAIPTYNEEKDIKECLNSISAQNCKKDLFEVIIIDNYSEDNTPEIANSFSKKINIRLYKNKIKDAEVSKKLAFEKAKGELFMYLDADMRFSSPDFITKMLFPFQDDKRIAGNFVQFVVNKSHPTLTRVLSYDEFQRDPIFKFFTLGIKEILEEKKEFYWLCKCSPEKVPPQGLMIYKKALIKDYAKTQSQLIDNEIPAVLISQGENYFAFVPSVGVEHLLLRSLKELWKKRIRNLKRTYFPNVQERKFKWLNWKKDFPKVGIWLLYTHSPLPLLNSITKMLKYKDSCFLAEPLLNLVSTYSIIYGVLSNRLK